MVRSNMGNEENGAMTLAAPRPSQATSTRDEESRPVETQAVEAERPAHCSRVRMRKPLPPPGPRAKPQTNDFRRLDTLVLLKEEIKHLQQEMKVLREAERCRLDETRALCEAHKQELGLQAKEFSADAKRLISEIKRKDKTIVSLEKQMGVLHTQCDKLQAFKSEVGTKKKRAMAPDPAKERLEVVRAEATLDNAKIPAETSPVNGLLTSHASNGLPELNDLATLRTDSIAGASIKCPNETLVLVSDLVVKNDVSCQFPELDLKIESTLEFKPLSTENPISPESPLIQESTTAESASQLPVDVEVKEQYSQTSLFPGSMLDNVVPLDTLYGVLVEEHMGLHMRLEELRKKIDEERARRQKSESHLTERELNPINVALANRIEQLDRDKTVLETRITELSEENDLLEFRLLEMEDLTTTKRAASRGSETRCDLTDLDDISDSGVMSLPTSEDDALSLSESERYSGASGVDVKWRLSWLSQQADNVSDRVCLQQALAMLRHYEARTQALEAPSHLASARLRSDYCDNDSRSLGRIVATVLPFSEHIKDSIEDKPCKDPLQESGIFEESQATFSKSTQTDPPEPPGDLSQEIRKLAQIRERIEEKSSSRKRTLPAEGLDPKQSGLRELIFYRERVAVLEGRLAEYEKQPEHKETRARIDRESLLEAELRRLGERTDWLEEENSRLQEENSELEEAENDTRLRCQKLELKISSLGEKKSSLKAQLDQSSRTIANLNNSLMEEERKKNDARQHLNRMEALVHSYEKKNFELEEREMEVRYRLQMLENTMPALMMWNMWRMLMSAQGGGVPDVRSTGAMTGGNAPPEANIAGREGELMVKLRALENKLFSENALLEESRKAEEDLKEKIQTLEKMLAQNEGNLINFNEKIDEVGIVEKLSILARERLEKDKKIRDLELREKFYQETLQQADGLFAEMENKYVQQIREKDDEINDKDNKLSESLSKVKQLNTEIANNSELQDKLATLESEAKLLHDKLVKREHEKQHLENEERRLKKDLNSTLEQIDKLKSGLATTKGDLETERKNKRQLKESIKWMEREHEREQQERDLEVSKYKHQISQLGRELQESEVTISELREEVQTLEMAIKELKEVTAKEKERVEMARLQLEKELTKKDQRLEELEGRGREVERSLSDELAEVGAAWGRSGIKTDPDSLLGPPTVASDDAALGLPLPPLRTRSARHIQAVIKQIDAPQDLKKCDVAGAAIAAMNGKDIKRSMENLSRAYQHSRIKEHLQI